MDTLLTAVAGADPAVAEVILAGMAKGWPRGKAVTLSAATEQALAKRLPALTPAGKGQLLRLAAAWGAQGLTKYAAEAAQGLLGVIGDDKQSDAAQSAAARQYVEFQSGDVKAAQQLLDLVTPRASPALAAGLIDALGASSAPAVGPALVQRLGGLPPSARAAALRVLLGRPDLTRTLLDALDKGDVQLGELTLDQKEALTAHPDAKIAARARKSWRAAAACPAPTARRSSTSCCRSRSKRATPSWASSSSRNIVPPATCMAARGTRSAPT